MTGKSERLARDFPEGAISRGGIRMKNIFTGIKYRLTSLILNARYRRDPPEKIIEPVGIAKGDIVLDYGCGPGKYTVAAARLVGEFGKIFALDIHPISARQVRRLRRKHCLANVETITSGGETGLADASVDVVLLYDIYHILKNPAMILEELHRVLNPGGFLSMSDHHMREPDILEGMQAGGLFKFDRKAGDIVYNFTRAG